MRVRPMQLSIALSATLLLTIAGPPRARAQGPRAHRPHRESPRVARLVRQAREQVLQYTAASSRQALALARQAVALDSLSAPTWVQLAWGYDAVGDFEPDSADAFVDLNIAAGHRAFEIDSTNGGAMLTEAAIRAYHNDVSPSTERLARDSAAKESGVVADALLAWVLLNRGEVDEAVSLIRRSGARYATLPITWAYSGYRFANAGHFVEAAAAWEHALALRPSAHDSVPLRNMRRWALLERGDCAGALAEARPARSWFLIIESLRCLRRTAEADSVIDSRLATSTISPGPRAICLAWRDQPDSAFAVLDRAFPNAMGITLLNPTFDPYRQHPSYLALRRRMGLAS